MERRKLTLILAVLSLLFIFSLACKQSGEIITPAEATQRWQATQDADLGDVVTSVEGAEFAPGDQAVLTSPGHLVGLYKEADGRTPFSYATRGDEVTVTSAVEIEGVIWYQIDSTAGDGWLPESNLDPLGE